MVQKPCDAGLIVNFHREQTLGLKTMRFVQAAVEALEARGTSLHPYLVLDRPDDFTKSKIRSAAEHLARCDIMEVDFGNLGASRSAGIARCREEIVFFLDGDDFLSFNWFEGALNFFRNQGADGRRLIAHTQYFVGFDKQQFVRVGLDSRDPDFDPLSLAADWFFCNNLACHRAIFDDVPIEPYDHASGFGAEDWHWSCETIARGYAHVLIPDTSYFYRNKPAKFSLGATAELITRKSALFEPQLVNSLPVHRAKDDVPCDLPALEDAFFEEAERLVPFDFGLSYLRSIRSGAGNLHYFRPHVPALVGKTIRDYCAGWQNRACLEIIFADVERLPGGIAAIESVMRYLSAQDGSSEQPARLYILEGDPGSLFPTREIRVLWLEKLRAAGTTDAQIAKIVARPFIQNANVRVYNFISPRRRSLAASHALAKRHSMTSWQNVILEYGFDRFSNTAADIGEIEESGIPSRTIAIFEKTAREFCAETGASIWHSAYLERVFARTVVNGQPICLEDGSSKSHPVKVSSIDPLRELVFPQPQTAPAAQFRMVGGICVEFEGDLEALCGGFVYLVLGNCRPGVEMQMAMRQATAPQEPAIAVPALIVHRRERTGLYFRPDVPRMNAELAAGIFPADLLYCPVVGFDARTVLAAARAHPRSGRLRISALLHRGVLSGSSRGVMSIGHDTVVSCSDEDMNTLNRPRVVREIAERSNEDSLQLRQHEYSRPC